MPRVLLSYPRKEAGQAIVLAYAVTKYIFTDFAFGESLQRVFFRSGEDPSMSALVVMKTPTCGLQ